MNEKRLNEQHSEQMKASTESDASRDGGEDENGKGGDVPIDTSPLRTNPSVEFLETVPDGERHCVVGIGASAGGLEALEQFFSQVSTDTGMSFVVVQHLSPDFKSHMDQLLGRVTELGIEVVSDGVAVQPNTVYLIPPGSEMVISNGRLLLTERSRDNVLSHPIDQFFRSLSQDVGTRAIGIILSGTGSDGSRGVREIAGAGGLVIAQEPSSCRFDSMPLNAQETGCVHLVMTPNAMGDAIRRYVQEGQTPDTLRDQQTLGLEKTGLKRVFQLLESAHAIDFSHYKPSTVQRRIQRRMELRGIEQLDEYVDLVNQEPSEVNELYKDLLIGVTRFFRDQGAFDFLRNDVLPEQLQKLSGKTLRIWVCGCATGEEAYSLAILLIEAIEDLGLDLEFKMFATDAHRESLQKAAAGVYREEKLENVSPERRKRFFRKAVDGYHVSSDVRRRIVFAPHNVISDPPFTQMHLVTCRNLLIYLQPPAQRKTLSLFHFSLRSGGVLFLGPSESTGDIKDEFEPLEKHWKIFRKRRDVRLPIELRLPTAARGELPLTSDKEILPTPPRKTDSDALPAIYQALLGEVMPPSVVVSEDAEILHAFSGSEAFLHFPMGRPTTDLLQVIAPGIKNSVAAAMQHALKDDAPVRYSGLPHPGNSEHSLRLMVRPIRVPAVKIRCLLIQFDELDQPVRVEADRDVRDFDSNDAASERIEGLEQELSFSRQNLQATIEELETSNEELQATNEEMVAANEELQSTNEELHSVNEELYTVNAEHQKRLAELDEAHSDMNHLLATTRVGVIFLDRDLAIRRYTPEVGRMLWLEPHDVGRKIQHFVSRLNDERFVDRLRDVLESHDEAEWEIQSQDGYYLVRALPYRRKQQVSGVVIAFVNIDSLKQSERERLLLEKAVASVDSGILICDAERADIPITFVNNGFVKMTGYSAEEALGRNCRFLQGRNTDPAAIEKMRQAIAQQVHCRVLVENYRKDGTPFWNDIYITPVRGPHNNVTHFVGIQNDVTERIRIGESVRQNERTTRLLLDSTAEGIFGMDSDGFCTFCNSAAAKMLHFDQTTELVGKRIYDVIQPSDEDGTTLPYDESLITSSIRKKQNIHCREQRFHRRDGQAFPVEFWSHPICMEDRCIGAVVTFVDDTERRVREQELRDMRDAAYEANAAKSRFLANMSHELRTPLAAMLGFTKIIQTEYDDSDLAEKLAAISRNGDYLLRLVGDVLDLSRIESGKFETSLVSVSTAELLCDIRDTMRMRTEEYGTVLKFSVRGDLPETITTDTARFRQILINLIANAIKFTPQGVVEVNAWHLVPADDSGDRLEIEIKDNGIGISQDQLDRLFEPFTQADRTINERFGGSGLGLSITKRLLDALGGTIGVQSQQGEGSCFTVSIPVAPCGQTIAIDLDGLAGAQVEPSPDTSAEKVETLSLSARVLIADDMRDVRFIAQHFLKKAGCDVEVVENGQLAVHAVEQAAQEGRPFDLVLMDVQMPVLSGVQAVRLLRQKKIDIPVIALTADAMKGTRRRLLEEGFDEYLSKPLSVERLQRVASRLLDRNRQTCD